MPMIDPAGTQFSYDGYTIEQWAADVAAVAEAFGIDSYTCVGHSRRGSSRIRYRD
jgi:pimeloyl-ACP methyl ester carboxylesterase